jgi:hypothetical protein
MDSTAPLGTRCAEKARSRCAASAIDGAIRSIGMGAGCTDEGAAATDGGWVVVT